jgi:hypothetical protein
MDIVLEFFNSPMWLDTIKDFVLANCFIFTGEEEFSHEHNNCHQEFCKIIENTLNIYLLDVIGISFDMFQRACIESANKPNSVGAKVLSILKQATDFRYFAAKMYAYNLMLDREAATTFVVSGPGPDAFFVTSGAAEQEVKRTDEMVQLATADLNKVEEELGLPPSIPVFEEPVKEEPKKEEAPVAQPAPAPTAEDKMKTIVTPLTVMPKISDAEREAMKLKIQREKEALAKTVTEEEMRKRKEAFQKRKEQLVAQKRTVCKDNIELNIKKHEKPVPIPEEDRDEALRRALAKRVKTIINE